MADKHVEIHDPFHGHSGLSSSSDCTNTSASDSENTENMIEFRILLAYASRRRQKEATESGHDHPSPLKSGHANGTPLSQTEEINGKRQKRKLWKRPKLPKVLTCLKPQTKKDDPSGDGEDVGSATLRCAGGQHKDDLGNVAARLAEISDEVPFVPPEIEADTPDDHDVEKVIGLLLRDAGDRLNERELKGTHIMNLLGNYSLFERVMVVFLERMGLGFETKTQQVTKAHIAVTCEATSRLSVLDTLPMNRVLGHGAAFMRTYFSSWADQHGGYENAFDSEEEEDEVH